MISMEEALSRIAAHALVTDKTERIALDLAAGRVLTEDVYSPIDMPPFRRSAMDGYALCLSDGHTYNVVGEVRAGDSRLSALRPGDAARIFTGAQLPDTANAVAMQENVVSNGGRIVLKTPCVNGENIRPQGEEIAKGHVALFKNTRLTPAGIGFLASLGIETAAVFSRPSIAIIITGDELQPPGQPLASGKIYESNFFMLQGALERLGYTSVTRYRVQDDFISARETIQDAISHHDIVLLSGGISVGDYDFSGKALNEIGVRTVFYTVNQKPGKPLYFGMTHDNTPVFALPGNPASALTCFYVYVYRLLQLWEGNTAYRFQTLSLPCRSRFKKKKNYTCFLKAHVEKGAVTIVAVGAGSVRGHLSRDRANTCKKIHGTDLLDAHGREIVGFRHRDDT